MSKPNTIIIGAGGHARACIDVIEQHGEYKIAGLVGTEEELGLQCLGYSVIATDDDLPQLADAYPFAFLAMGQIASPDKRIQLYRRINQLGFRSPQIIASTAFVSRRATVGMGTIVMHGAIVNAAATVGENCIINTRALVEHDATVEDNCHISTGAIVNGNVRVGAGSFLGSGSVIKDSVLMGENCVVGMGLCVRHDLASHTRFLGHNKQ